MSDHLIKPKGRLYSLDLFLRATRLPGIRRFRLIIVLPLDDPMFPFHLRDIQVYLLICKIKRWYQIMGDVFVTQNKAMFSSFMNISLYICKGFFFKSIFMKPGLRIHPFPIIWIGITTVSMLKILFTVLPPKDGRNATTFFIDKIQERFPIFEKEADQSYKPFRQSL